MHRHIHTCTEMQACTHNYTPTHTYMHRQLNSLWPEVEPWVNQDSAQGFLFKREFCMLTLGVLKFISKIALQSQEQCLGASFLHTCHTHVKILDLPKHTHKHAHTNTQTHMHTHTHTHSPKQNQIHNTNSSSTNDSDYLSFFIRP